MKNFYKLLSILLLFFYFFSAIGSEETEFKELEGMSMEDLLDIEIEIASKSSESLFDAPSSVTVFTRQEILAMGITSVEELLNFVPGFQSSREIVFNQGYMVASRGKSSPQASYNILFMIDGQRINNILSGGALTTNHFITLANVKQVEIIRGPGSALYGTNAFTGIVNVVTTKETNDLFLSGGNLNSREGYANISHRGESWKTSLFLRHFNDDGDSYGERYTHLVNENVSSTKDPRFGNDIYFSFSWNNFLELNARHMNRKLDDFFMFKYLNDKSQFFKSSQEFVNLKIKLIDKSAYKLELTGSYLKMSENAATLASSSSPDLSETTFDEHEWRAALDTSYSFDEKNKLQVGLVYRRPELVTAEQVTVDIITLEQKDKVEQVETGERNVLGAYIQHKLAIYDILKTTVGVRHDYYSDFGHTTNPRAALILYPGFDANFKLMYGHAFRAPTKRQISAIGPGNHDLTPETAKTFEAAWMQKLFTLQTTVTYFHSWFDDKIDTVVQEDRNRVFMNTDDLTTHGVEIEAHALIAEHVNLRGSYSYLFETEEEPRRVAKQTFSMIANLNYGPLNINASGYFHDEMEMVALFPGNERETITLDSYLIMNAALHYKLYNEISFVARAWNLLDKEYHSSTKMIVYNEGFPNRGRAFSLGLEMTF